VLDYVNYKVNPIGLSQIRGVASEVKARQKPENRFSRISKFIVKAVNYYADEEFQKSGFPLRWIE